MARIYDQYALVETNHVAAVRTGEIKAQYTVANEASLENGMLLVVDDIAKEVGFSADGSEANIYLHASEERIYEAHLGRKSFVLDGATQMPKMLKLTNGDIFETNAVDDGDFANLAAVKTALAVPTAVYGIAGTDGLIELKDGADVGWDPTAYEVIVEVVEVVTLPNETEGMKFVVVKG